MSVRRRAWITESGEGRSGWVVDYKDAAGRRHQELFDRRADADAYEAQTKVQVRMGVHTAPSTSPAVAEAAADWLAYVGGEGRERATLAQRQHVERHINPRIGNVRLARLTTPGINAFRDELLRDLSRALAKKVLTSLKSLLCDAQRRGNVAQNVALPVNIEMNGRHKRKLEVGIDIPTPDEARLILNSANELRPLLVTAVFTGLRASELRGLRWPDIDFQRAELTIRQRADRYNVLGPPKSEAGKRTIPLGPLVLNALKEWKLACPKSDLNLVFPTASGEIRHHKNLVNALKGVLVAAGIVVVLKDRRGKPRTDAQGKPIVQPKYSGLHSLRHFYASWCINRRADGGLELPPKTVQERLGHSSIVITMDTYGHLFPRKDDGSELAAAERGLLGPHTI